MFNEEEDIREAAELEAMRWHVVRSGDTLYGLAIANRTTVAEICRLNGISSKATLRIGQKLRVR
jgi:LysM repeat protein